MPLTRQITLQTDTPQLFQGLLLSRKLVAAHLHSMHPANRPNRPAALGPERSGEADQPAGE